MRVSRLFATPSLAAFFLLGGLALASPAGAQGSAVSLPSGNFGMSAEGDALEMTFTDPSFPVIQTVSSSPYGASAAISSLGQSLADAGAPYSPVVYGLPGTVNGLGSGGQLPYVPPLPGYASSSYPAKPSSVEELDGYELTANSSPSDSKGQVQLGSQPPGAANPTMYATAESVVNSDGSVTATATAGADAFNFGQLFDIGNLTSAETLTVPPTGAPRLKSSMDLGTITVLGLKNGLTLDGFNALGTTTPLPLTTTLIPSVNSLLKPSGVSLAYLPATFAYTDGTVGTGSSPDPRKTLQGVDSGALEISVQEDVSGQGLVSYTYTLGRVYVSAVNPAGSSLGSGTSTGLQSGGTGITGALRTSTGASTSPAAVATTSPGPTGGASAAATPAAGIESQGNTNQSQIRPSSPPPVLSAVAGPSNASLYLILVLGALVAFFASQLIRLLAVRLSLFGGPDR